MATFDVSLRDNGSADFDVALSSGASAPQRFPMWWRSASLLVALGQFDQPPTPPVNQQTLHAFRAYPVPQSGHFLVPINQVVLLDAALGPPRPNHSSALFFGRGAPTAATTPWYLWRPAATPVIVEPPAERVDHTRLHLYRTGFQTVGQPWATWPPYRPNTVRAEEYTAPAASLDLHRYRVGFQTVGQSPWLLGWRSNVPNIDSSYATPSAPPTLHQYRFGFQTVGQPWAMWPVYRTTTSAPDDFRCPAYDLFPFRQFAPVAPVSSQALAMWPLYRAPTLALEEYRRPAASDLFPFRQFAPSGPVVGQPWFIWPVYSMRIEPEALPVQPRHTDLHRYRVGYQTVGQPYALLSWSSRRQRTEAETYEVRSKQPRWFWITQAPAVTAGQPWALMNRQTPRQPVEAEQYRVRLPSLFWWWTTPSAPIVIKGPLVRAVKEGFYLGHYRNIGDVFQLENLADLSDSTIDYMAGTSDSPVYGWMQVLYYPYSLLDQAQFLTGTVRDHPRRTVL